MSTCECVYVYVSVSVCGSGVWSVRRQQRSSCVLYGCIRLTDRFTPFSPQPHTLQNNSPVLESTEARPYTTDAHAEEGATR